VQRREDQKPAKGQMQILMTDDSKGTLHQHLHVRAPPDIALPDLMGSVARLRHSRTEQQGPTCVQDPELSIPPWPEDPRLREKVRTGRCIVTFFSLLR